MTKQVRPNIGHVSCAECGSVAALRQNKGGKLYYDCLSCGRITPNHAGGQGKIKERAVIWGPAGAPSGIPIWIADAWPYGLAIRMRDEGLKLKGSEPAGDIALRRRLDEHIRSEKVEDEISVAGRSPEQPASLPEAPPPPPARKPPKVTSRKTVERPEPARSWLDEL